MFPVHSGRVHRADGAWATDLSSDDRAVRDHAAADLRDFLKKTLHRAFANQLSDSDIDDLAQESMLRIHRKLDSFQRRSRFTTWAAAIGVNLALSELRRRKYKHLTLDDAVSATEAALASAGSSASSSSLASYQVGVEAALEQRERDQQLREAIEQALTDRQKTALLAELGGLPLIEVARRMNTSRGALYKLLHDARKRLRAHFDQRGLLASDLLSAPEGAP